MYSLILRGAVNPAILGTVFWSVRTYIKPRRLLPPGATAAEAAAADADFERAPNLDKRDVVLSW